MIESIEGLASGQPSIEGHRLSVQHVVANVDELGLKDYVESFDLGDDPDIMDKIERAVDYCRTEECEEDGERGKLVRYCHYCSKSATSRCNVWEIAQKVYELNYD